MVIGLPRKDSYLLTSLLCVIFDIASPIFPGPITLNIRVTPCICCSRKRDRFQGFQRSNFI